MISWSRDVEGLGQGFTRVVGINMPSRTLGPTFLEQVVEENWNECPTGVCAVWHVSMRASIQLQEVSDLVEP